jgi:hypothetical protein
MYCAECEAITTELGEVYAEAWFSCDGKTKEVWLAVYGMIGGTEDDAEKAEEVTRGLPFPEPRGSLFGLPGRGYTGFPKANKIAQVLQRKFAHEARSRHKIRFPPGH